MPSKPIRIFIIAGEASGDSIGAKLCQSFSKVARAKFYGIGGDKMRASGVKIFSDYKEINLMGFAEILFKIPRLWWKIRKTVNEIIKFKPDCIVTIDSSGFNDRVMKLVRKKMGASVKAVRYVSSPVWAYRYSRIFRVAKYYDHILLILPFEKKLYDEINCPATYVGHPLLEDDFTPNIKKEDLLAQYGFGKDAEIITFMPGSRRQEIELMLSIFQSVINKLNNGKRLFFIPTLTKLQVNCENTVVSSDSVVKRNMLAHSNLAVVKSGTSSLEMVFYRTPTIVAHKVSAISAFIIKRFIKIPYVSLANIIMNAKVIPEFLQENCTKENILKSVNQFLNNEKVIKKQLNDFEIIQKKLQSVGGKVPSIEAAKKILEVINEKA